MANANEVRPTETSRAVTSDASAPEMCTPHALVTAPMKPLVESEIVLPSSKAADGAAAAVDVERSIATPDLGMDAEERAASDHMLQQSGPGAVDLLRMLAPDGPWNVRTISSLNGGGPQLPKKLGYHVGSKNADDRQNGIMGWICTAEAGLHNCYLHVVIGPEEKQKLGKSDVIGSRAVWVDIDPDPKRFEKSRAEILTAMRAEDPPFSCIVDSGNGFQGYKFIEPYRMNGDTALIAELEKRNYAISESMRKRLKGTGVKVDSCHSAEHLMRLPDTTNFMTAAKRKKGYPEGNRPAHIVEWHPERVHRLIDLPACPLPDENRPQADSESPQGKSTEPAVFDIWKDPRLAKVSDRTKRIIELGFDPEEPKPEKGDTSRSGWLQTALCGLFGAECNEALARVVIGDPRWRISDSVLEKRGNARERAISRTISHARLWIAEQQENEKARLLARYDELNASYFVIGSIGGHCRVGEFIELHGRERLNLMSFSDFANREPQPFVKCEYASRKRPFGEVWARSQNRRYYDRVTFKPDGPRVLAGNVLNLWQGFAVEPTKGTWARLRRHIWKVLANRDPKAFKYIIRWTAWALQNPDKVAGVALAFRGGQGAGKGVFARTVKNIFGQHGAHTSSLEKVTGRFNAVLQDCCLLFLDEVHLPRGSDALGNFKRMITEPSLQIERKGVDVDNDWPNCLHIIMVGNGEQIAPVESDDRRFAVFDVSDECKDQGEYFDALYAEIENGGAAAMLYDLLNMKLGDWRPFPAYRNAAHRKQKALNLSPVQAFVERLLHDQRLPGAPADRLNWCPSHSADGTGLFDKPFKESCDRRCVDLAPAAFRQTLKDCGAKSALSRDRKHRGWEFKSPGECRSLWEKRFGSWDWDSATTTAWGLPPATDHQEELAQAEAEMRRAQTRLEAVKAKREITDEIPF